MDVPAGTVDVPDMKDGYALRIGMSDVLFDTGSSCSDSGESGEGSLSGRAVSGSGERGDSVLVVRSCSSSLVVEDSGSSSRSGSRIGWSETRGLMDPENTLGLESVDELPAGAGCLSITGFCPYVAVIDLSCREFVGFSPSGTGILLGIV